MSRLQVQRSLPTVRYRHGEMLGIRDQIQVRPVVVAEVIFQGFVEAVAKDEPRLAPALPTK